MPVDWDDKNRAASDVGSAHLEKVCSPDAKGAHYWHHQWKKMVEATLAARRETDALLEESFRAAPPFSEPNFKARLESERRKLEDLLRFLREDAAGEHR